MLTEKMQKALNEQLNWELYSSYLYLSMSAHFHSVVLMGFANWMRVQALEELIHAGKFFDFINNRGGTVSLQTIQGPETSWPSPLAAFEAALGHERKVTMRINDLVDLALQEKDHATHIFLQWFVTEQVEEESSVGDVINKLKLTAEQAGGLFMVDQELAARVFTMPLGPGGKPGA
jgi:ferritin